MCGQILQRASRYSRTAQEFGSSETRASPQGTKNHFVCCCPLRTLGTEERGSSIKAHDFARFFGVCNVVDALNLDPELVCAIQERIVKCRMKVPLKENPRRRGKIRERHVFLGRTAMPFRQHDGERGTANDRARQERVVKRVADNCEVELARANA